MKVSVWWLIALFAAGVAAAAIYFGVFYIPASTITHRKRKDYDVVTFKLPNSKDTGVFGPRQWEARHFLDQLIPCSACREHAIPLGVFVHDIVNLSTGKQLFNKENWKEHVRLVNELNAKA